MPTARELLANRRRILVTGGAGFNCCAEAKGYGGAVVRRLLAESDAQVFNLDKMGYASDLSSIETLPQAAERHTLLRVYLTDAAGTAEAVRQADPGSSDALGGREPCGPLNRGPHRLRLDKLAGLRLHRQQRDGQFPSIASGVLPLGGAANRASQRLPLPPHLHR
jgi:NAD(P)-dependent dehydrogenase (short-subunit alcohol dehydrogenase family)